MPLILPYSFSTYKILGIDPGLNNTGISVFEIDYQTKNILAITAFTLVNNRLPDYTGLDDEIYNERTIKLYKLKDAIKQVVININPSAIACESPFYNRLCPMAYGALLETLNVMKSAVIEVNTNIPFTTVEPLLVKKTVGAGMTTGKLDMKDAISKNNIIMSVLSSDMNLLDEHSIDAIGVAYTYLKLSGVV